MSPPTAWEESGGNVLLEPEQALGILRCSSKSLIAGFRQASGTIPTEFSETGYAGICQASSMQQCKSKQAKLSTSVVLAAR